MSQAEIHQISGVMRRESGQLSRLSSRAGWLQLVILFVELIASFSLPGAGAQRNYVLDLNPDTIDVAISKYETIMVEFYAPWCGHCKRLTPEYEKASQILYEKASHAKLARIDTDAYYKPIASKYDIGGYPTLRLYTNGIPTETEYDGRRTAEAIVSYVMRYVIPPVTNITTESDLTLFLRNVSDNSAVFVGFGLDSSVLEELAKKHRRKAFFAAMKDFSGKVMIEFNFDKAPALVSLHPKLEEHDVLYGPFNDGDIGDFVLQHLMPSVSCIESTDIIKRLTEDRRPIAIGIVESMSDSTSQSFVHNLKAAATENRAFVFAYVEIVKFLSFTQSFGVGKSSLLPTVIIWDGENHFSKPERADAFIGVNAGTRLTEFLQDYRDEKLKLLDLVEPSLLMLVKKTIFGIPALLLVSVIVLVVIALRSCYFEDISGDGDHEDDYRERGRRTDLEGDIVVDRGLTDNVDPLHFGRKSQKRD